MAVDVVTEIEINRPREQVAAFAADPVNATAWYKNIESVEWKTPPPLAAGSKLRFRARFLGRTLDYTYDVKRTNLDAASLCQRQRDPFRWRRPTPGRTGQTAERG